ncbi:Rieske 2Fe-2S domain-containing protein [bacterium]|nr:Rieske 2Fe-2S domain-containing protein [bacterium]
MTRDRARDETRRRFLRLTGRTAAVCLAVPVLHQLGGCGGQTDEAADAAPTTLRIPLAELPDGLRVYRELNGVPVEIRREGDEIIARSLLCTHQGCTVQWQPDVQEYLCPCHEGRFDADGEVIEGMPTRPLPTFPVRREADVVIVES